LFLKVFICCIIRNIHDAKIPREIPSKIGLNNINLTLFKILKGIKLSYLKSRAIIKYIDKATSVFLKENMIVKYSSFFIFIPS
ncbi:hypothetical protein, partial [Cetobacterium sp.]|uniref:hypothetical protein n=1 Tax=Cetobacterium sp. TaxID=2071632 RepID=UPI003F663993